MAALGDNTTSRTGPWISRRAIAATALMLVGLVGVGLIVRMLTPQTPFELPTEFASDLPHTCRQVLCVETSHVDSTHGTMLRLERSSGSNTWHAVGSAFPASVGHNGLGWGIGLHRSPRPDRYPMKVEGDKRSPAGVFRISTVFGMADESEAGPLKMPYIALRPGIVGVDDPKSAHYNRIVDSRDVKRDWDSNESMSRHKKLYQWGAFINHNPDQIPGRGSCIFLHLWPGEGRSTSGCTATSATPLQTLVRWLDASKDPCLVQFAAE